jgi:hypothetical protein
MFTDLFAFGKDPIWDVLVRFIVNTVVLFILIRGIFYRYYKKKDFSFILYLMGIMIFLLCILLRQADISMGVGFGLFGLFSILRFRSKNLDFKPMAYLFVAIGTSAINALGTFYNPVRGPILINAVILIAVYLLELSFPKAEKVKEQNDLPKIQ